MESKVKVFGHSVHPILIVFPLGLLSSSLVFDGLRLLTRDASFGLTSRRVIGAGILGAGVAAPFGLIDWLAIPAGTRAKKIGRWHAIGNSVALSCFSLSWLLRKNPRRVALPMTLSVIGAAFSAISGWLGGELIERLGVGVDDNANLDAPNSITHEHIYPRTTAPTIVH